MNERWVANVVYARAAGGETFEFIHSFGRPNGLLAS